MIKYAALFSSSLLLLAAMAPMALKAEESAGIRWILEVSIKDGKAEELESLIAKMAEAAEANEPGTLGYKWMISNDRTIGQVFEHYADSEAALVHLKSFNTNFAQSLLALVEPGRYTVYGNPSEALRSAIAGFKPIYMSEAGGFDRSR